MNTKQKLTLGIAAIFMVTLTVVGVTYAYFVTRVNYTGTETTAVIETASIGSSFHANSDTVILDNAIPGQMTWKTFFVKSGSTQDVPFAIKVSTSLNVRPDLLEENPTKTDWNVADHASPAFIHTLKDDEVTPAVEGFVVDDICYMESTTPEQKANCYTGTRYDNIEMTVYEVKPEDYTGTSDDFKDESIISEVPTDGSGNIVNLTTESGKTVRASVISKNTSDYAKNIKAPFNGSFSTASGAIFVGDMQRVKAKANNDAPDNYNLYVFKVAYINRNKNQNIENDASISLKIDIDGTANITQ